MLDLPGLMNLLAAPQHIGHVGDTDGVPLLRQHAEQARGIPHSLALDGRYKVAREFESSSLLQGVLDIRDSPANCETCAFGGIFASSSPERCSPQGSARLGVQEVLNAIPVEGAFLVLAVFEDGVSQELLRRVDVCSPTAALRP